jgi:hypothetical protein
LTRTCPSASANQLLGAGELAKLDRELQIPFSHQKIDKIIKEFDQDPVLASGD